ncbi:FAD-binding oxidoreductase [Streptomyces sp. VRA16 Mangrove soil]|uniref:FAD-binding oxidoreductase n=1 Tax=Streptomyces sp. VRA16 Mangrove soil TaxID=2817434 RepID=UPI001A9F81EF|nr:FAD-binding oxidoreductase [Streptomyces sp. VRA16 Mangrove soil]MBO1334338.1 FAD-binding oxidoreductase [Streptomyces sp. VRA16 Mangrove soil]
MPVPSDSFPVSEHALPDHLAALAIRPGDSAYDAVRHTYTRLGSPAAVLRVRDAEDIAAALVHARDSHLPLTVRSGGHGISGRSTNNGGLVIDLSRLASVTVLDADARLVRIEAGARWGDVAAALAPYGMALSSGDTGDVGVGGLATAGGIGLMARAHGLTIDHMRAAELVLADGSAVRVDAQHDPDLFWAVRGAGANFGVATAFEFEAARVDGVCVDVSVFDAADTAGFLTRWGGWIERSPREVTSFLTLATGPGGLPVAQVMTVYAGGDMDAARPALRPLGSIGAVLQNQLVATPYHRLLPAGHQPQYAQQPLTVSRSGLLHHIDDQVAHAIATVAPAAGIVQLRSVGGAVNDMPATATAYAHRTQNFSLMAATVPALRGDLDQRWDGLTPHIDGLYLSFETRTGPRQLSDAFPQPVLGRLLTLKDRYDPDNVFTNNFALRRPAGDGDVRKR